MLPDSDTCGQEAIYCVWRDITERKAIEEKLLRQNAVLNAILDNFPGAISLFDAELRLVAHNAQFRSLLDLPDSLFARPDLRFEDIIRYNVARGDVEATPRSSSPRSWPVPAPARRTIWNASVPMAWHWTFAACRCRGRLRHHLHRHHRTQGHGGAGAAPGLLRCPDQSSAIAACLTTA